ncbi:MAG: orotidine 5'-phosphate decarboxylase [Candidatus Magasanikbacteria bacterium RIFCSPHIGHO2_02_FULL_47_14]|uniref:orotidine-5'-phosphate decarboxylase n=1 Tax=Candidatus Magasanikbacteria bacterium RIFCSPHIGHO2_02_FULL_47_14 TaxID=1798680 RepID=A0A1F6MA67_9BACT|nr:MAG: orotidine 5'-phosphate decarboxylase [Candidatus Magasanikbacteria bacterium RIFCSPHIGHO2_02_FULL_47_14]
MPKLSYKQRAELSKNPTARRLFGIMEEKETNLCVAVDVTTKKELLELAEAVAPSICVLKTRTDTINDFDEDLIIRLQRLSEKHNFLLFEDHTFADIGIAVRHQYQDGIYHIADWADIINAHPIVGPGVIEGLKEIGLRKGRGLLLLAQMTTKDNLISSEYTAEAVRMAEGHTDFAIGFISNGNVSNNPQFIHFTPGVHINREADRLGQQYQSPEEAIKQGADIIIVGRGITKSHDPQAAANRYQEIAWEAANNF